jgi:hypothetical protein
MNADVQQLLRYELVRNDWDYWAPMLENYGLAAVAQYVAAMERMRSGYPFFMDNA